MNETELRKAVGARIRERREELGFSMKEVADRLAVNKSTVLRYESGLIDNTKKLVIEGLADVLSISPEWLLTGSEKEDDEKPDYLDVRIRKKLDEILGRYPFKTSAAENTFSKGLLMLMLECFDEYNQRHEKYSQFISNHENDDLYKEYEHEDHEDTCRRYYKMNILHITDDICYISELLKYYYALKDEAFSFVKDRLKSKTGIDIDYGA